MAEYEFLTETVVKMSVLVGYHLKWSVSYAHFFLRDQKNVQSGYERF